MEDFIDQLEVIENELACMSTEDFRAIEEPDTNQYLDSEIPSHSSCFDMEHTTSRPDLRNLKYKSLTDHLQCPICQQPFIKPLTTLCGHTFCSDCIMECFKMSKDSTSDVIGLCPLDRTPIDSTNSNDLFPTPILINNLVDELKVYCLNHERGCEWSGCRWEVEHHVIADCEHTGVKCNGKRGRKECSLLVERKYKSTEECVHKLFECSYCKEQIAKVTEEDHLSNECLFNYQTCEICANDMIPLKSLAQHQENCTKSTKHICPAKSIGCSFIGNNEPSLENHVQNNCQLNKFLPFYNKMNDKLETLTKENENLRSLINKILNLIIQGKITNLGYNEPIEEINKFKNFEDLDQDKLIYLNYEIERLKYQIDEKLIPFIDKQTNEREPVLNNLVSDSFMMKDDLNLQRMLINSLRKQIQFILFKNHRPTFNGMNNPVFDEDLSDSDERLNLKL